MTTLTIKFRNNKQALLLKKFVEDLEGVEEIVLSKEKKLNGVTRDSHFLRKYEVSEKDFYSRVKKAEKDIKEGRVYPVKEVMKRMKQRHAKDLKKL